MPLIATPGASNANSYITLAEGDAYNNQHLQAAIWQAADTFTKEAAIRQATAMLDRYVRWVGGRSSFTQALAWPRNGVVYTDTWSFEWGQTLSGNPIPGDIIPQWLKDATAELARYLIANPEREGGALSGVKSVRVAEVSLDLETSDAATFPQSVQAMIAPYIGVGGGIVKRLVRM